MPKAAGIHQSDNSIKANVSIGTCICSNNLVSRDAKTKKKERCVDLVTGDGVESMNPLC